MTTETKTHWKKLTNPDYLGSYSLQPKEEKVLTIKNVVREKVKGVGGKSQDCTVCHFVENEKPMILNKTNCKIIAKIYSTPFIENWAGKQIKIYVDIADAFGEQVECLRIRMQQPALPILTADHPSYQEVIKFIKKNGLIEDVTKKFIVTPEMETKIKKDAI